MQNWIIACILLSITEPAKLIHFERQSIEADPGNIQTVALICVATGSPQPKITWHNSKSQITLKAVESSDTPGYYKSRLTLRAGQDVGEYSCAVQNTYSGTVQHVFAAPTAGELISSCSVISIILCMCSELINA